MKSLAVRALGFALAVGILELGSWALLAASPQLRARMELAAQGSDAGARGQAHARIGHKLPGGAFLEESIHPYLGFAVTPSPAALAGPLTLESLGLPGGGSLVREARDDTVVVGLFGGSVAAYLARSGGVEAIFEGLQPLPAFAGRKLVPLVAAHLGYKQPQSLMALAYLHSLGVHFDVVLLLDGFNEVMAAPLELIPAGVFPFYPGRWHQRVANLDVATDMRARIGEIAVLGEQRQRWAQRLLGSPLRHSRTAQLLWALWDSSLERQLEAARGALANERATQGRDFAATGPQWRGGDDALVGELASVWFESSLAMRALAEARGAHFFHFLQPNQHVAGTKPMDDDERNVAIRGGESFAPDVERGYRELRRRGEELRARGTRFHDLTQIFGDVREPIYVDNIGHVGKRGNERIAAAIAADIRADLGAPR